MSDISWNRLKKVLQQDRENAIRTLLQIGITEAQANICRGQVNQIDKILKEYPQRLVLNED